ncbi:MAG: hypothetical protein WCJ37_03360 [Syntrophus sp. (in: bacteria)]
MNWKLKERIAEKYGTQSDFAIVLRGHESDVSRVIRGRRTLTEAERQMWADLLGADRAELFGEEADHVQN